MGYNLTIGELFVGDPDATPGEEVYVFTGVVLNSGVDIGAPLNSNDDTSNSVAPSYCVWSEFLRDVGLVDVFSNRDGICEHYGLFTKHPGMVRLCQRHIDRFRDALEKYTQRVPRTVDTEYNFRRLEWLVFWTEWSLTNCKMPVFENG